MEAPVVLVIVRLFGSLQWNQQHEMMVHESFKLPWNGVNAWNVSSVRVPLLSTEVKPWVAPSLSGPFYLLHTDGGSRDLLPRRTPSSASAWTQINFAFPPRLLFRSKRLEWPWRRLTFSRNIALITSEVLHGWFNFISLFFPQELILEAARLSPCQGVRPRTKGMFKQLEACCHSDRRSLSILWRIYFFDQNIQGPKVEKWWSSDFAGPSAGFFAFETLKTVVFLWCDL